MKTAMKWLLGAFVLAMVLGAIGAACNDDGEEIPAPAKESEERTEPTETIDVSDEQQEAIEEAQGYLDDSVTYGITWSRERLIGHLEYTYSREVAEFAVETVDAVEGGVDWREQAVREVQSLMSEEDYYSREHALHRLTGGGDGDHTHADAEYALEQEWTDKPLAAFFLTRELEDREFGGPGLETKVDIFTDISCQSDPAEILNIPNAVTYEAMRDAAKEHGVRGPHWRINFDPTPGGLVLMVLDPDTGIVDECSEL